MSERDEFLKEIDSRFQALGKRIADLANVGLNCLELEKKLDSMLVKFDHLRENFSQEHKILQEKCKNQAKTADFAQFQIENIKDCFKRFSDSETELRNQFQDSLKSIQVLSGKNTESENKISQNELNLNILKRQIESLKKEKDLLDNEIFKLNDTVNNILLKFNPIYDSLNSSYNKSKELKEEINEIKLDVNKSVSNISNANFTNTYSINEKIDKLHEDLNKKISSIVIPDVSLFIDKKELMEIKHQVSLVSLDAKNSMAKSNNNEMQLQLIGKKIDGLFIQLKTQEFANS